MPVSHKGCHNRLVRKTEGTINAYGMFQSGDSVLVGVSGGPDSVALLYVLSRLAPRFSLSLGVAHLNHSLRQTDSDHDAAFVASLAKKLNLPCHIHQTDVRAYQRRHRLSTEEAARRVRYAFYDRIAAAYRFDKVALGHHSDDNAELVIMHLLRGSGPTGLAGIPPVRAGTIVRPFIEIGRAEIMDFLEANELAYVCDRSNQDPRFLRNRVRLELMPALKKAYNPLIAQSLNRVASIFRSENEWMEAMVTPLYDRALAESQEHRTILWASKLDNLPPAAVRRILRRAIAGVKGDLRRIGFAHICAVERLVAAGPNIGRLDLPDRISVRRENERLIFAKETMPLRSANGLRGKGAQWILPAPQFDYEITGPGIVRIPEVGQSFKFEALEKIDLEEIRQAGHSVAFFDMDKVLFPLQVRNCRAGDRFIPLGMTGGQKVKKYFSDNKVPGPQRVRCPLLLCGGKVIWVAGYRIADGVKVQPTTRRVLKVAQTLA